MVLVICLCHWMFEHRMMGEEQINCRNTSYHHPLFQLDLEGVVG